MCILQKQPEGRNLSATAIVNVDTGNYEETLSDMSSVCISPLSHSSNHKNRKHLVVFEQLLCIRVLKKHYFI